MERSGIYPSQSYCWFVTLLLFLPRFLRKYCAYDSNTRRSCVRSPSASWVSVWEQLGTSCCRDCTNHNRVYLVGQMVGLVGLVGVNSRPSRFSRLAVDSALTGLRCPLNCSVICGNNARVTVASGHCSRPGQHTHRFCVGHNISGGFAPSQAVNIDIGYPVCGILCTRAGGPPAPPSPLTRLPAQQSHHTSSPVPTGGSPG